VRVAGNIIWSPGIQARKQRQRLGKGGGRSTTTYRYSASFAVAFGEGPGKIVKLWFNDKLAYDATGASVQIKVQGLRFRAYEGDEAQQPDPLIVASKSDGKAPAYRGTIYVVFENLPLDEFGNRVPNVTALVSTQVSAANSDDAVGLPSGSYQADGAADFSTRRFYVRRLTGDTVAEVDYINATGRVLPINAASKFCVFPGGPLVAMAGGGGANTRPVAAWDVVSGAELWRFGTFNSGLTQTATGGVLAVGTNACAISVLGPRPRRFALLESRGTGDGVLPLCLDADTGTHIFGAATSGVVRLYEPAGGATGTYVQGAQRIGATEAWHICRGTSPSRIQFWRINLTDAAAWNPAPSLTTTGVTATLAGEVLASDLGFTSAGTPTVLDVGYDTSDDSVIVFAAWPGTVTNPQRFAFKWSAATGVVWRTPGHTNRIGVNASAYNQNLLIRERVAHLGDNDAVVMNARTGAIEFSGVVTSGNPGLIWPRFLYDGDFDIGVTFQRRVFLNRVTPGTVSLSGIVQAIATRAGLATSDLSLGALTDAVRGYVVSRAGTARDALEPLCAAYLFDLVETDGQMRGVKRGGGVAGSIAYADLLRPRPTEGVVTEDRAQDRELPRRLTVRFLDVGRDYEPGAQTWQRPAAPVAVSAADGNATVDIAVPMTATEARTLARRLLMSGWRERNRVTFAGTPRHLRFDPADVLSVTRADGTTMRLRLLRADLGADYTMRFEAAEEDPADYALTAQGVAGDYFQNGMPVPYPTRAFAPDLPLLADGDDTGGLALREYALAGAYSAAWRGVEVATSDDRVTWDALDVLTTSVAWGAAETDLAAPISATDLEVLNGANFAALINPVNGSLEIIQWTTATPNADGSFTLSRLLRGRRGTEDACATRAAGDLFLVLDDPETVLRYQTPLAALSATRYLRFLGRFDVPAAAAVATKSARGRAERPYAPVQIAGSRDGGNNLTITWVRRTRVGGELRDTSGVVPIAEASEAYEVDIRNAADTATLRTISGLSSPSATYTAAQQTTDGLTPGDPVRVRVFQISAAVGRGIPGSAVV
jgi:hypothetical protein